VLRAVQSDDMKQRLDGLAFEATAAPLKETADYVRAEVEKWGRVVRETKATVD
jgi:tripartite-type tricarboxylate transporter receptor subunit TctC